MAKNVNIDLKKLELALRKPTEAATINIARQIAKEQFNKNLDKLEEEIYADPMSQEIMAGPDLNTSKFIKGVGSRKHGGNLFSFIGFFAEDNPIQDLVKYIRFYSKIKTFTVRLVNNKYTFEVLAPTEKDIKSTFPFPDNTFGNRSWITGLEQGISNVINYIRASGYGRSEGGVQIKGEIDKTFKNKPGYFSEKYRRFIKSFNRK